MLRGPAFDGPDYDFIGARNRFRNMGENVYRQLRDLCAVDLAEIDAAVDHFIVRDIRRKDIGTVTTQLERILRHSRMLDDVRLVRVDLQKPADGPPAT
jgi:hypothetical protein